MPVWGAKTICEFMSNLANSLGQTKQNTLKNTSCEISKWPQKTARTQIKKNTLFFHSALLQCTSSMLPSCDILNGVGIPRRRGHVGASIWDGVSQLLKQLLGALGSLTEFGVAFRLV